MKHTHEHGHYVPHPRTVGGDYKSRVEHTHEHSHATPHQTESSVPGIRYAPTHRATHKHDAQHDPRAQARREWDAAADTSPIHTKRSIP